eukprot:ctg_1255.g480
MSATPLPPQPALPGAALAARPGAAQRVRGGATAATVRRLPGGSAAVALRRGPGGPAADPAHYRGGGAAGAVRHRVRAVAATGSTPPVGGVAYGPHRQALVHHGADERGAQVLRGSVGRVLGGVLAVPACQHMRGGVADAVNGRSVAAAVRLAAGELSHRRGGRRVGTGRRRAGGPGVAGGVCGRRRGRCIGRGHRTGEDEGFLDFVSLADAARDVERQVLGVGVRDDADDGVMAPDGRYAVPACRGRRRRLFFRMRNAYLAHLGEDGAERVPAALPRPGENQLLPDLVIVSNAVASRDFEAAARLVDACAARHVPVVLFNAFLDLANEVGSGSRASAAHLAALEASAFVAVARRRLPRPDMSLMEVVESVRSAAVLEAEPCYVCRAYPRVGAALRMLGGHRIGLDLFDDPRPLRAVEGVDDEHADPWHLFAEVSAFEYEYATQLLVPSPLAPAFGVPDVPRILREHCGYTAHRPEAANGNAFLEAIAPLRTPGADEYCKSQREGNCAGWWPCMSPVRSYHHPSRVWSLG